MTSAAPAVGAEDREHATFSASAAHRWIHCPGSLLPNLAAPDTTSPHAELGTAAHTLAEQWLRTPVDFDYPTAADALGIIDHVDDVRRYVDWARESADGADVTYIEKQVDFSDLTPIPNQFGTLDFCAIHGSDKGAVAILTDLKFGTGVRVFAERNEQLMIYALAIYQELDFIYDFKRFDLRICQPRLGHFDTWECSRAELLDFAEVVKRQAKIAMREDAPREPGEKPCRFCKVKATCPAILDAIHQMADESFEVLEPLTPARAGDVLVERPTLPAIESLTLEQRARIASFQKLVVGWFKAVHASLETDALAGVKIPGFKLAEGRSNRKWEDEAKAASGLSVWLDDPYQEPKLLTPAQAETALAKLKVAGMETKKDAKALVTNLSIKPPGKISLVPEKSDAEEVAEGEGADAFEALE